MLSVAPTLRQGAVQHGHLPHDCWVQVVVIDPLKLSCSSLKIPAHPVWFRVMMNYLLGKPWQAHVLAQELELALVVYWSPVSRALILVLTQHGNVVDLVADMRNLDWKLVGYVYATLRRSLAPPLFRA